MEMKYVPIEFDWFHETQDLSAEEKGRLMDGLMAYAMDEDPEQFLSGQERLIFRHYQRKVDLLRESIAEKTETQSRNGSKGGRPRSAPPKDENPSADENPKNPPLFSVFEENPKKQYKIENKKEKENQSEEEKENNRSILSDQIDQENVIVEGAAPDDAAQVIKAWEALDIGPAGEAAEKSELPARLKVHGLPAVLAVLEEVKRSDYLMGRTGGPPVKFSWLMQSDNFCKTLAGYYRTTSPPREKPAPGSITAIDPGRAAMLRRREAAKCV